MTIKRYDICEAWNGSMNTVCLPRTGVWVTYEDHAKEIADLRALAREAVKEAYAEAFDDAWNLARGLDPILNRNFFLGSKADEGLIQECWLKSGAACDFKDGDV